MKIQCPLDLDHKQLKSDNLQYNTLGSWDNGLIDQVSDFPNVILFIISFKILCKNPFNLFSYFFKKLQK